MKIESNFIVADLGYGSGFFTNPRSKKVKKVYGIDVQKGMLNFLEVKIRRLKIENIEPLLSTENEIPLENDRLDLLLLMNTLHEFDDRERMVCRLIGCLNRAELQLLQTSRRRTQGLALLLQ